MRSACSGVKSDSIVVPVFSSSVYVSEGRRGVGATAGTRTFTRSEERDRGGKGDQCCDCENEIGEELALQTVSGVVFEVGA
jgi:hypothetical protein